MTRIAARIVFALAPLAFADELAAKDPSILREWGGRVEVATPDPPAFVADEKALARVWQALRIAEKQPEIDFREHVLLGAMNRSSVVRIQPRMDEAGNLTRNVIATPDMPNFKTYVLVLVSRAGVKSIDGQPLPE